MHSDINAKIAKIRRQIEEISYTMVEAEGEEYEILSEKLEKLEAELEELNIINSDMELLYDYDD